MLNNYARMMNYLNHADARSGQRGVVILLFVITLLLGAAAIFYGLSTVTPPAIERDRKTAEALLLAKAALISYAVSVNFSGASATIRPGDLPCPDLTDSGTGTSCGNAAGSLQASRLGRLPWKTLGLPDLRDGDGERLWYAVSNNFKRNTRTTCTASAPESTTCLNSDTRGTITIRDTAGNILHDATNTDPTASGVIAVVFSPGAILRRQDGVTQNRSCTGDAGCDATGLCLGTTTPKCNPVNYLDISGGEDNANFSDASGVPSTNGFINGIILDRSGNLIVNDRLLVITYQELMPQLEKRVAAEVSNCLKAYATLNNGRYPWAAPVTNVTTPFSDGLNIVFGRIPDQPLLQTQLGATLITLPVATFLQPACDAAPSQCMRASWPPTCLLPSNPSVSSWWNNWKLHVFYSVADAYKPVISFTQPTPTTVSLGGITPPSGCPTCLTVNPPGSAADKKTVILVAGKRLPGVGTGQPRTSATIQDTANYLEGENNNSDSLFSKQSSSATFNDTVISSPP